METLIPAPTIAAQATPEPVQVLPLRPGVTRALLDVLLNDPASKAMLAAYAEAAGVPPTAAVNIGTSGLVLLVPADAALEPVDVVRGDEPDAPDAPDAPPDGGGG